MVFEHERDCSSQWSESVIGLFKTAVIRRKIPEYNSEDVEFATFDWVWRFNNHAFSSQMVILLQQSTRRCFTMLRPIKFLSYSSTNQVYGNLGVVTTLLTKSPMPKIAVTTVRGHLGTAIIRAPINLVGKENVIGLARTFKHGTSRS